VVPRAEEKFICTTTKLSHRLTGGGLASWWHASFSRQPSIERRINLR
jgi:hypothetical protein